MSKHRSVCASARRTKTLAAAAVISSGLAATSDLRAASMTFTPTRDTTIVGPDNAPNANFNHLDVVYVGRGSSVGTENRALLGFDLSALDGQVQSVNSVTLTVTVNSTAFNGVTSVQPEIYAIDPDNANWTASQATWNVRNGTDPWVGEPGLMEPGVDYDPAMLSTLAFTSADTAGTERVFTFSGDLTTLINGWASGPNAGLVLFDPDLPASTYVAFHSTEGPQENWPVLTVNYEPVPEPASLSLLAAAGLLLARRRRA